MSRGGCWCRGMDGPRVFDMREEGEEEEKD